LIKWLQIAQFLYSYTIFRSFHLSKRHYKCSNEPKVNQVIRKTATRASLIPVFIHLTALPFQTFRYKQHHHRHTLQQRHDENQRMANRGYQQLLAGPTAEAYSISGHISPTCSSHYLISHYHYSISGGPGPQFNDNPFDLSEFLGVLPEPELRNDHTCENPQVPVQPALEEVTVFSDISAVGELLLKQYPYRYSTQPSGNGSNHIQSANSQTPGPTNPIGRFNDRDKSDKGSKVTK